MDDSAVSGDSGSLVYNSSLVNVHPIVEALIQTDSTNPVPTQVEAQLTWNGGSAQGWNSWRKGRVGRWRGGLGRPCV